MSAKALSAEAESELCKYLDSICDKCSETWVEGLTRRTLCPSCGANNKSIYCEGCLRLLVPSEHRPTELPAELPFDLDIIVDDRLSSSSGIHYKVLWDTLRPDQSDKCTVVNYLRGSGEKLPLYEEGTYLLFPSEKSQPISSIQPKSKIQRIVVLDCSWSRSSVRLEPNISRLPQVHLDHPPMQSQYWRWHSAGEGMLCTIEAIYYTACHFVPPSVAVHGLWLFAIQKAVIQHKYAMGQVRFLKSKSTLPENISPFSAEMKNYRRSLRYKKQQDKSKGGTF